MNTATAPNWNPDALKQAVALPPPTPATVTVGDEKEVTDKADAFRKAIMSASELAETNIPPRESIASPFYCVKDLGFIFGVRGEGKSWIAMLIAIAIAKGESLFSWVVTKPRRVLFCDGEMPLESIKERQQGLGDAPANLFFLQHELLYDRTTQSLDLADPIAQAALIKIIAERQIEVLILDNLSSLFFGLKENEADSWEIVLEWLLEMRRIGISVIIAAHAGRNGEMRGTSKREDHAFWVMKVTKVEVGDGERATRFRTNFTKSRNCPLSDCPPIEWTLRPDGSRIGVSARPVTNEFAILGLIDSDVTTASDIAEELNLSKGRVSQIVSTLRDRGWIEVSNRHYKITSTGKARLADQTLRERHD